MTISHKASKILLSNQTIPIDQYTSALFHYDITANDVLSGIEPILNTTTLREGKFGGGIAVEEGTANLWTGAMNIYNNYASNGQMTASLIALSETYMGQPVYRLSITPISANAVTSIKNDMWSHGVYGSSRSYASGNTYMSSIYWRPVNKADISVGGTASNISGWSDIGTYNQNDGWNRSIAKWSSNITATDNKYWSFKSPSAVANETIVIDWVCPQIEQKTLATSYVNGTRGNGSLTYSKNIINPKEGTISFWFNTQSKSPQTYSRLFQLGGWSSDISSDNLEIRWGSGWSNADSIDFEFTQGGTGVRYTLSTGVIGITSNTWYFIAVTWIAGGRYSLTLINNSNGKKTYSEGIATNAMPTFSKQNSFDIGSGSGITNTIIDELRIDRIERSSEEIESWYISNQPFYPKGIYRLAY